MNAITVRQPIAERFIRGRQFVINRDWGVAHHLKHGFYGIHAAATKREVTCFDEEQYPTMVFGAFVAVAWLAAVEYIENVRPFVDKYPGFQWLTDHTYAKGPDCWIFDAVFVLKEPVPHKGEKGLWHVPYPVVRRLRAGYDERRVLRPHECLETQERIGP